MNSGKYVFAQILTFVSRWEFDKCVERYNGDHRTRELTCWNLFVQLLFDQLISLNSLRDTCLCLKAHKNKLYHLGVKQNVNQSSLSRANESRDWRIFADFGQYLISVVQPLYTDENLPEVYAENQVFALDSTTIALSIKLFTWAFGKYSRGAVKVHTLLDLRGSIPTFIHISHGKYHDSNVLDFMPLEKDAIYVMDKAYVDFVALYEMEQVGAIFVTKAKDNMVFEVVEAMRIVVYRDIEKDISLIFITNNFELSALDVAYIYKNRWQIEVFKWIKQNLTIKRLWGHSENSVHIHIWVALSAYLLVAYIKAQLRSELSVYEVMQILSISAFDKTPIAELLTEIHSNQNIKEQPTLFD